MRYTPREAAEKLGYSYCYFLRLLKAGRFQYHRISQRKIYLTDEDLQRAQDGYFIPAKNPCGDSEGAAV